MTELVQHQSDLAAEMQYAQAISGGALLPVAYRGKPADILIATGLGKAIGIAPAQALYDIYVVNGRPSPSANLMAALVRRAGHKIRVTGDATSCTATLIRKDDPDEPFTATWTLDQARGAGLANKDTWKQYPAAMLRARAVSEVVRMGASECVLGMDYSAEEMRDVEPGSNPAPTFIPATRTPEQAAPAPDEPVDAVEVLEPQQALTDHTRRKMFALLNEVDPESNAATQRKGMSVVLGREVKSRADLSEDDALRIIDALLAELTKREADAIQRGEA